MWEARSITCSPQAGTNAVIYDATVKSMVVYMSVVLFLPYGRIADFFEEVYGLRISQGSMVNWISQAKRVPLPPLGESNSTS